MVGFLASRILFGLRRNSYLSLFTLLSFLGMALGTACLLIIMAFMTGAQQLIRDKYLSATPHLSVLPVSGRFLAETAGMERKLLALPGVMRVERKLTLPAAGPDWLGEVEGSDGVAGVQAPFGLPGDRFTLLVPLLDLTPLGLGPRSLPLVKREGSPRPDRVRVPLEALRAALAVPDRLTAYEIFLDDPDGAAALRPGVRRLAGPSTRVLTFGDLNAPLFLALGMEKWLMFAGTGLVLLVAFLQLHQSFELLILHGQATWATLQALGAGDGPIRRVFIAMALAIASAGGLAGGALAYALGSLQNRHHLIPLPAGMAHLGQVPLLFSPWTTLALGALLLSLSVLTALPAGRKAAATPIVRTLYAPQ
jgi:lipoprotein-releasing system permease protein